MEPEVTGLAPQLKCLSKLLEEHPDKFVSGSQEIRDAALSATKFIFDHALNSETESRSHILELISSLTAWDAPQTRSQTRAIGEKRKRSESPRSKKLIRTFDNTPLGSLFIDGMEDEQIWEQLDLRAKTVCGLLEDALGEAEHHDDDSDLGSDDAETRKMLRVLEALDNNVITLDDIEDDDDTTLDEDGFLDQDSDDDDSDDSEEDDDDEDEEEEEAEVDNDAEPGEGITGLQDSASSSGDEDEDQSFSESEVGIPKGGDQSVLDDNFFNLASFNAESEAAEAKYVSRGSLGQNSDEEASEEEDDNVVDMFAPVDEFEHFDENDLEQNDGEAHYRDFFDPPPKNKRKGQTQEATGKVRFHEVVRVREIKASKKRKPLWTGNLLGFQEGPVTDLHGEHDFGDFHDTHQDHDSIDPDDASIKGDDDQAIKGRETIARLKDDLFAEEDDHDAGNLSTHEKRMAALRQEISRLEDENVGKKDWVLMGEATSRSRPQNSLLEEDLEFDRAMKAVPVITEENVQVLEEKIKARILEGRFDDVVRKRPVDDKPFLPSRLIELKDTKSTQSLAQIYEADYVAAQSGDVVVDDRDGRLKKEHEELEKLWDDICWKLDAICNAHFVPKQPRATISTVLNTPAVTLESALPTAKSLSTMLAPEEIFAPNPSDLRAKSELTPTEKRAVRNKERKSKKKTRDILNKSVDKYSRMKGIRGIKKQKEEALKSVVKSGKGVTVLGKKSKSRRPLTTR